MKRTTSAKDKENQALPPLSDEGCTPAVHIKSGPPAGETPRASSQQVPSCRSPDPTPADSDQAEPGEAVSSMPGGPDPEAVSEKAKPAQLLVHTPEARPLSPLSPSLQSPQQENVSPVGKAASPPLVKSPEARSSNRVKSPAAARSKSTRRSWGFAMAARLAASLRQSLEGDPAAPKQESQSPIAQSPTPESKPSALSDEHKPAHDALDHQRCRDADVSAKSPPNQGLTRDSAEDPYGPMFSPLSLGLDQMQAGAAFQEEGPEADSSSFNHADDLDMLQKQAGMQRGRHAASACDGPDAAAAQESETSHVATDLAEDVSSPLLICPVLPETPSAGASNDDAAADDVVPDAILLQPHVITPSTTSSGQTIADRIQMAADSSAGNQQQPVVKHASTSSNDGPVTSTPIRTFLNFRSSGKKVQSVASQVDEQEGEDQPESPSPLREGLAFMTPLSAFDGSPEPHAGLPAEHLHLDSLANDAVALGTSRPRMQALEECQDELLEGEPAAGAAAVHGKSETHPPQPAGPATKEPLPTRPTGQQPDGMPLAAGEAAADSGGTSLAMPAPSTPPTKASNNLMHGPSLPPNLTKGLAAPTAAPAPTPRNAFSLLSVGTMWDEPSTPAAGIPAWTDADSPEPTPAPFSVFTSHPTPSTAAMPQSKARLPVPTNCEPLMSSTPASAARKLSGESRTADNVACRANHNVETATAGSVVNVSEPGVPQPAAHSHLGGAVSEESPALGLLHQAASSRAGKDSQAPGQAAGHRTPANVPAAELPGVDQQEMESADPPQQGSNHQAASMDLSGRSTSHASPPKASAEHEQQSAARQGQSDPRLASPAAAVASPESQAGGLILTHKRPGSPSRASNGDSASQPSPKRARAQDGSAASPSNISTGAATPTLDRLVADDAHAPARQAGPVPPVSTLHVENIPKVSAAGCSRKPDIGHTSQLKEQLPADSPCLSSHGAGTSDSPLPCGFQQAEETKAPSAESAGPINKDSHALPFAGASDKGTSPAIADSNGVVSEERQATADLQQNLGIMTSAGNKMSLAACPMSCVQAGPNVHASIAVSLQHQSGGTLSANHAANDLADNAASAADSSQPITMAAGMQASGDSTKVNSPTHDLAKCEGTASKLSRQTADPSQMQAPQEDGMRVTCHDADGPADIDEAATKPAKQAQDASNVQASNGALPQTSAPAAVSLADGEDAAATSAMQAQNASDLQTISPAADKLADIVGSAAKRIAKAAEYRGTEDTLAMRNMPAADSSANVDGAAPNTPRRAQDASDLQACRQHSAKVSSPAANDPAENHGSAAMSPQRVLHTSGVLAACKDLHSASSAAAGVNGSAISSPQSLHSASITQTSCELLANVRSPAQLMLSADKQAGGQVFNGIGKPAAPETGMHALDAEHPLGTPAIGESPAQLLSSTPGKLGQMSDLVKPPSSSDAEAAPGTLIPTQDGPSGVHDPVPTVQEQAMSVTGASSAPGATDAACVPETACKTSPAQDATKQLGTTSARQARGSAGKSGVDATRMHELPRASSHASGQHGASAPAREANLQISGRNTANGWSSSEALRFDIPPRTDVATMHLLAAAEHEPKQMLNVMVLNDTPSASAGATHRAIDEHPEQVATAPASAAQRQAAPVLEQTCNETAPVFAQSEATEPTSSSSPAKINPKAANMKTDDRQHQMSSAAGNTGELMLDRPPSLSAAAAPADPGEHRHMHDDQSANAADQPASTPDTHNLTSASPAADQTLELDQAVVPVSIEFGLPSASVKPQDTDIMSDRPVKAAGSLMPTAMRPAQRPDGHLLAAPGSALTESPPEPMCAAVSIQDDAIGVAAAGLVEKDHQAAHFLAQAPPLAQAESEHPGDQGRSQLHTAVVPAKPSEAARSLQSEEMRPENVQTSEVAKPQTVQTPQSRRSHQAATGLADAGNQSLTSQAASTEPCPEKGHRSTAASPDAAQTSTSEAVQSASSQSTGDGFVPMASPTRHERPSMASELIQEGNVLPVDALNSQAAEAMSPVQMTPFTSRPRSRLIVELAGAADDETEEAEPGLHSPEFAPEFAHEVARMLGDSSQNNSPGAVEDVLELISPDAKAEARLTAEEIASLVPDLQDLQGLSRHSLLRRAARMSVEACTLGREKAELLVLHRDRSALILRLRDERSQADIKSSTRLKQLEVQLAQARRSLGETDGKFRTLYQEKYVPLKAEHQQQADLFKSLAHEHTEAVQAHEELQFALKRCEQERDAARQDASSTREQLTFAQNEAEAAREAIAATAQEQQASAQASLRDQLAAAEEAAKMATESSNASHQQMLDSQAEAKQMQQKLSDMDALLRSFKHQNDRFADTKMQYEADARKLTKQLQEKADENDMLLRICPGTVCSLLPGSKRPSKCSVLAWPYYSRLAVRSLVSVGDCPAGYESLANIAEHHLEVKKSKFVTVAGPVQSAQEAVNFRDVHSDPAASHNCFAWVIGSEVRSSDDGEPAGTAGGPILNAIQGQQLDHVCVLVIRYFGGTKLGSGGLVRAYGAAARECLRTAPKQFCPIMAAFTLQVPFDCLGAAYLAFEPHQVQREEETYLETGHVAMQIRIAATAAPALQAALADSTRPQWPTITLPKGLVRMLLDGEDDNQHWIWPPLLIVFIMQHSLECSRASSRRAFIDMATSIL
ncbi:hypothetical protein WJX74_003847 [Apatococcus lobatus]|uniref:Impact N-terminal domain-containing protein n=1 Tax=Apatococcus lobatus TaxID=904363 RepID=A0AAW1RET8_9CHLO